MNEQHYSFVKCAPDNKKKSEVWNYVLQKASIQVKAGKTREVDYSHPAEYRCIYCLAEVSTNADCSTSNIIRHLETHGMNVVFIYATR